MSAKGISRDIQSAAGSLEGICQVTGRHEAGNYAYAIVVSRFNEHLTTALLQSAVACLTQHGAKPTQIKVVWVPGAFEIPVVANKLAQAGKHHAIITLGVVLEGETLHARLISNSLVRGITMTSRENNLPIIDGVVTGNTLKQAEKRCLSGEDSRGWYAALAAMEMAHVMNAL
ncbi:MAG: 6,7-dimethyl-8-ribityllumazine synthase [Kiritimatiellia bacterium]|jgi:6,7-dimethyl-8-ribityllumazine synthase